MTRSKVLIATAIVVTSMQSASIDATDVPLHQILEQQIDKSLEKEAAEVQCSTAFPICLMAI